MKFSPRQHLRLADSLDGKADREPDPQRAKKQKAMAKLYRQLARRAYNLKPDAID